MKHTLVFCLAMTAVSVGTTAAEEKLALKDLPPVVQKTVRDQSKGAQIQGLSKETEKGKTSYEVETLVNGKHRDFVVDANGAVTEVEEETALDRIPVAARAAIEKKVADGKMGRVETVTGGAAIMYEATYTSKDGKQHEVRVTPDGKVKD